MTRHVIIFEPIKWRLFLKISARLFFIFLGLSIGSFLAGTSYYSIYSMSVYAIAVLLIGTILAPLVASHYNILIFEGRITGPGRYGVFQPAEEILIADLIKPIYRNQTFYEKNFGFHLLRSVKGKTITVNNFIYGEAALTEIRKILDASFPESQKIES